MNRTTRILLATLTTMSFMAAAAPAFAEASPEATKWLDRVRDTVNHQPFRVDYTFELSGSIEGQPMSANAKGNLLQGGPGLSINELDMQAAMGAGGADMMSMHSRQVSDGTMLWAETYIENMGLTQVGKVELAVLREVAAKNSGLELDQSMMFMDPISQIETLVKAFDVEVEEGDAGTVNLLLSPTKATLAQLGTDGADGVEMSGVLVLEKKHALPVSMDVALGKELTIRMDFSSFEILEAQDIPKGTFTYTPEAGVQVVDMAPMFKAGM